nr:PREDICTED: poly [ADP-ribose] polymerase 2 [Lepisosteus oculatus]
MDVGRVCGRGACAVKNHSAHCPAVCSVPPEVVKRVVFKGRAPVDAECKAKLGKAHVYCEGEDVYDVMLNQTNVQFNNNKYYLIQLLQDDGPQVYSVWMRWGRGTSLFFDKTKNEWEDRSRFEKVAGKYDIVHMDYSTEEKFVLRAAGKATSCISHHILLCSLSLSLSVFRLRTPPLIRSEQELKEKIALLEALSDIQIAVKMVQSSASGDEHPLDRQYHTLCCELEPMEPSSQEYQLLERYLQSTHASTHSDYTMTVLDIFTVNRKGEEEAFCSHLHNRTLLWHGSRLSNWVGILNKGLRVAPPEAPVTGYMFGKGIYFADMSSKSANYCFANQKNSTGLLLLSEVALGDCNELLHADYNADKLPPGKHSTKGLGQTAPDPRNAVALDGVGVPLGPAVRTGVANEQGYTLLYNEFVVYDPNQVRMRFLLRVRFNYPSPW